MSKPKLSPWFSVETKPVHIGLYDIRDRSIRCNCCCTWAHWDGSQFVRYGKMAGILDVRQVVHGVREWRGLAEEPK